MVFIPILGLGGILFAIITFFTVLKKPEGLDKMREISYEVHKGAMVFLSREYRIILIFVAI
ncbi:MAG: sodium/proton-translocating pyrophosphatase, partial [Candidatus Omnitrophota bacterium]|nr:sodium/proton-translocating pyrophosphatase [Candidatus Omnitrophota bacterium]